MKPFVQFSIPRAEGLQHLQARRRGYTVVELMMAVSIFALGVVGTVSMQTVAVSANQHGRNLTIATRIAESWLDELSADSSHWNSTNDFDDSDWLGLAGVETTSNPAWQVPPYIETRRFGPAFDSLGNVVATADIEEQAKFCTHVRLTWVYAQDTVKAGNGLILAEVRVYWQRPGSNTYTTTPPNNLCTFPAAGFDDGTGDRLYYSVYLSTTLRQHVVDN